MRWLVIASISLAFSISGCQPWHRTAPTSPAPETPNRPPQATASNTRQATKESANQRQPSRTSNREQTQQNQATDSQGPVRRGPLNEPAGITDPQRHAGEKLLETDLYELYGQSSYSGSWCFQGYEAGVKQIFKVDANFVIKDDETYAERFEREILPILRAQCKSLKKVSIYHFIKGVRIDQWMKEYREDESVSGPEQPLSMMAVQINPQGMLTYTMYRHESLAALRAKRDADAQARPLEEARQKRNKERAEEAAAKRAALEAAADERLAAMHATADGQLSLSGIDNEHKRLFLMIYDGDFVALSERKDIQDLPIILYRNAMFRYDKVCHKFFSDRVSVKETVEVFDHQEWNPLTRTMTPVNKKITDTSYMERRYEQAFRSTFGKNIVTALKHSQKDVNERVTRRPGLWDDILNKGKVMMEEASKEKERVEKGNASLDLLLSPDACGKPGIVRFMDNINRYVTHDFPSEVFAQPVNGTYPYTQDDTEYEGYQMIERFYQRVPRGTFSPEFPTLPHEKELFIWLNKDDYKTLGLRTIKITRLHLMDLTPDRTNTPTRLPPDVQQAIAEKKYVVVQCGYIAKGGGEMNFYYWSANGPVPSESVQTYAKKNISAPRMACPIRPE